MPVARGRVLDPVLSLACTAAENVGDCVFRVDADTVQKVDIFDRAKMPCMGVILAKLSPTKCLVQKVGPVGVYAGLIPGKVYGVGIDARPSPTVPYFAGAFVQVLGIGETDSSLHLEINLQLTLVKG